MAPSPPRPTPAKYQPLLQQLQQLPAERVQLQLTRTELTALLGPLARTTLLDGYWRYSGTAQRNWLAEGFVARWDSTTQVVTFTRTPGPNQDDPTAPAPVWGTA